MLRTSLPSSMSKSFHSRAHSGRLDSPPSDVMLLFFSQKAFNRDSMLIFLVEETPVRSCCVFSLQLLALCLSSGSEAAAGEKAEAEGEKAEGEAFSNKFRKDASSSSAG